MPRKVYEHRVASDWDRAIEVSVSEVAVRVVCDAPGIASVSHSLSWGEWRELVAAVDESWPEAPVS